MMGAGDSEDDVGLGVAGLVAPPDRVALQGHSGLILHFIQRASIAVLLIDMMISSNDESAKLVPLICTAGLCGITITSSMISSEADGEGVPLALHKSLLRLVLGINYYGANLFSSVVDSICSFMGNMDPYQCGFLALFILASPAMLVPKDTMSIEMRLLCIVSYATAATGEAMSADEDEDEDGVGSAAIVSVPPREQVPLAVLQGENGLVFYLILPGPVVLMLDGAEVMDLWMAQVRATMAQV
ncbi:hypothetical protein FRC07_010701 [Ceratobasidium sp. 392]|nr:hypothetical protein FRC07_010701 [Ceratobasidium sp. 392]